MATPLRRAAAVHKQECATALQRTDRSPQDLYGPVVETLPCCIKVKVPESLRSVLDGLELHKIRNKQSRRSKYENHKVCKQIVDYAVRDRRAIVLEKLEKVLLVMPSLGTEAQQCA